MFKKKAERDELLQHRTKTLASYRSHERNEDYWAIKEDLTRQFWSQLPVFTWSICPFCETEFTFPVDIFGFDSLYWATWDTVLFEEDFESKNIAPQYCEHLLLTELAIDYKQKPIFIDERNLHDPGDGELQSFEQQPFIIPQHISKKNIRLVISDFELPSGMTVYPLVYFQEDKAKPKIHFTNNWLPDFALEKWVKQNKVRWCIKEKDGKLRLNTKDEKYPYSDLTQNEFAYLGSLNAGYHIYDEP